MKSYHIADLFCGAGGTSTGAMEAIQTLGYTPHLTAVNHWDKAIATHAKNHPTMRHLCTGVDSVNPRDLYAGGKLDLLWASPECTHHSLARGGKPINDQSRAIALDNSIAPETKDTTPTETLAAALAALTTSRLPTGKI